MRTIYFFIGGLSVYYFIALIIQYYLLLPVLNKYGAMKKSLIVAALISSACMVLLFYISKVKGISLPLIAYAGPFPVWIVFFVLGIYLGKNGIIKKSRTKFLILTLIGLSLSVAETYMNIYLSNSFSGLGIKLGAFIYSFFIIMYLFTFKDIENSDSKLWNGMFYIGKYSFSIYLIHLYFLDYVVKPITNNIIVNNYFIQQLLLITLTLLCCLIFIFIMRKINTKFTVKYLGF